MTKNDIGRENLLVIMGVLIRVWLQGTLWLSWAVLAFAIAYFVSILIALCLGSALPTAAIFGWIPGGDILDRAIPFAAVPILIVCAMGALCGWASRFGIMGVSEYRDLEQPLIRFWSRAGLPVIMALLLLAISSGGWNGRFELSHMTYLSIGDLVPNSDASAFYTSAFDLIYRGDWNIVASRRPLAAAMRDALTLAGGMSYVWSLILQAILIAGMFVLALRSFMAWQGIWVAGAFLALAYGLIQPFLTTTMTEPLGAAWALLSLAFFIEALRTRSAPHAIVGLAALCLGLMARMGSMLTIPFLMVWVVIAFARSRREAFHLTAIVIAAMALILGVNLGLIALFAPDAQLGGNFSYIVCGLARGTDWAECITTFSKQLQDLPDLKSQNNFLYAQAFEAFKQEPTILIYSLAENAARYMRGMINLLIGQYHQIVHMPKLLRFGFIALCIPGLIVAMRGQPLVRSFWLTMVVSTILSAALIFDDDGARTMHVTYVFMAAFIALGFSAPATLRRVDDIPTISPRAGMVGIGIALFVIVCATFALKWGSTEKRIETANEGNSTGQMVEPSYGFAGFLVIPDTVAHMPTTPFMKFSSFRTIFSQSLLMNDFGPVAEKTETHLPFTFFVAPLTGNLYVGPPEILTDKSAKKWLFDVSPLGSSGRLFFIQKATNVSELEKRASPAD